MSSESDQGHRWMAYAPPSASADALHESVQDVHLRVDEHAGPFWSSDGALGDDPDELRTELGLSRALYDDVLAWHAAALARDADPDAVFAGQQELLRRLALEVRPGIAVPAPREAPPRPFSLLEDDLGATGLPESLLTEIEAWRAGAATHWYALEAEDAEVWAWQDRGQALADRVGEVLGDDWAVRWR